MARLIVDTGFLVALYIRGDSLHQAAVGFLQRQSAALITVPAVKRCKTVVKQLAQAQQIRIRLTRQSKIEKILILLTFGKNANHINELKIYRKSISHCVKRTFFEMSTEPSLGNNLL